MDSNRNLENQSRLVGALALSVILVLFALGLRFILKELLNPALIAKVRFEDVGTLRNQSPVIYQGVLVGEVRSIHRENGLALVELEMFQHLDLSSDSKIINFNYSLFGDRLIFINQGIEDSRIDWSLEQEGVFKAGVAETLHKVDSLLQTFQSLNKLATEILVGTESQPSISQIFSRQVLPVFTELNSMLGNFSNTEKTLKISLQQSASLSQQIRGMVRIGAKGTEQFLITSDSMLTQSAYLLESLNSSTEKIAVQMQALTDPDNAVNQILLRKELFQSLNQFTLSLNQLLKILKQDGLSEIIGFWKNVHILGTNPTKKQK